MVLGPCPAVSCVKHYVGPPLHLPSTVAAAGRTVITRQALGHHAAMPVGSINDKDSIARKRTYAETVANYVTPRVAPHIAIATHM